jgi:hypothetical protein
MSNDEVRQAVKDTLVTDVSLPCIGVHCNTLIFTLDLRTGR